MAAPRRPNLWSRRELGLVALAALPLAQTPAGTRPKAAGSTIRGVRIGVQSFSFRSLPDGAAIVRAIAQIGLASVELMSNHAEAMAGAPRDPAGLRAWRDKVQPDAFAAVRRTFNDAGIAVD